MGIDLLEIRLFGGLDLRYDGQPIAPPESMRASSLLAYLLLNRQTPQLREQIAFLLWPDSLESQARTNLRHVLHHLRRALPDADRFIAITPQTLQWRSTGDSWLDVAAFEQLIATAQTGSDERARIAALRDAVRLYTGELLAGWYDEWVLTARDRLQQQYAQLLERLVTALEACGETSEAISYAEELLHHDPLNEEAYRLLMRLYTARGDRARALRLYHVCVSTLQRELDVEPSPETLAAYQALLPVSFEPASSRQVASGGSSFVGRDAERRSLATHWYAAEQGTAQCVVLTGESGVGKTRLAEELRTWSAHRGAAVAMARSYAAEGALAYAPVVNWLRSEPIAQRRQSLSPAVLADLSRLLPEIASESPHLPAPVALPEAEQRQRLFDALVSAIATVEEPLLLVLDDIHWSDRETIQFLHYLIRTRPSARLLILATARQEELDAGHPFHDLAAGLSTLERFSDIVIDRFDVTGTATLAAQLAGRSLTADEAEQLYRETEGNPLFIVEAIRAGWTDTRDWITPRVQAVIQSRFAKLSDAASEVVGIAATIGREFTTDILAQVSGHSEESMIGALDELWRRRIIREQGVEGYDFTHDKLREVAYGALSPVRRRHVHLRVAQALERIHAGDPGPVSGQLAAHYEQAGAADTAVHWYIRAAEAAQHMHAHSEAIRLLQRGITLIRSLPASTDRQHNELALLTALLGPLVAIRGFQSDYAEQIHERALQLTRTLGVEAAPPLLWSVAVSNLVRGNLDEARIYGEQLQARGEREADDVVAVQGTYVLGITSYWNAEFPVAQAHFESVIERFKPSDRRTHLLQYGNDPAVVCKMRLAFAHWFLGHTAMARNLRDEAFAEAVTHQDWFTRLGVVHFSALLSIELGDHDYLRACIAVLEEIGDSHPTMYLQHNGDASAGYLDILDGRRAEGLERIHRALDDLRGGVQLPGQRASVTKVLLSACAVLDDPIAGLAAAEQLRRSGVGARIWEAEGHRMRAEFMAALGHDPDEVAVELHRALRIARSQQAKSIELRIATSLLRHHLTRDNPDAISAARDHLADIVALVTDGTDTADLRAALALLDRS